MNKTPIIQTTDQLLFDLQKIDKTYHVGDVYKTVDSSLTANDLSRTFGGTWQKMTNTSWYNFYKFPVFTISSSHTSETKSLSITTTGGPVFINVNGDNNPQTDGGAWCVVYVYRGDTQIGHQVPVSIGNSNNLPFSFTYIDAPGAGTYTYKVTFSIGGGTVQFGETGSLQTPQFMIYEMNNRNDPYIKWERVS